MNYKKEAALWVIIHYLVVVALLGVFMWNHTKIADTFKDFADPDRFFTVVDEDGGSGSYDKWYAEQLKNGNALWFPDMLIGYILILSFPFLMREMIRNWDDLSYLSTTFRVPAMIMAMHMVYIIFIDIRLYFAGLPTAPVCECFPPAPPLPFYDCHCIIPHHKGQARILAKNPYNFTEKELRAGGVDASRMYSGNATIEFVDSASNSSFDGPQMRETLDFSMEFVLVQATVFIVILRLRPYRLFQIHVTGSKELSIFHVILESYYFLMAESLDALALFNEFIENGYVFIDNTPLVDIIWLFTSLVIFHLAFGTCSYEALHSDIDTKSEMTSCKLLAKFIVIMACNLPLLCIRLYLVSIYGEEERNNIIFILFIIREIAMIILGLVDLSCEVVALFKEDYADSEDKDSHSEDIDEDEISERNEE